MNNEQKSVAYIIGNSYVAIAQLPGVYTIDQFFSALFENNLPKNSRWIIGQGIHDSVADILNLCKNHRSDICFDSTEKIQETSTLFSKLSQMIKALAHCFGFHR